MKIKDCMFHDSQVLSTWQKEKRSLKYIQSLKPLDANNILQDMSTLILTYIHLFVFPPFTKSDLLFLK